MFASSRTSGRSTALASAIAAVVLLGLFARPAIETTPPPPAVPMQLSASGKVIDRLPGHATTAPSFAVPGEHAMPGTAFAYAFAATVSSAAAGSGAAHEPAPVQEARAALPAKTTRAPARPPKAVSVAAALPPARPASLRLAQPATEVAAAPERRASVASRMIAFVGSLASLARPL